jgi:glycine cleavage system H lipoate-binding protein/TusA-related sulfurtransferase
VQRIKNCLFADDVLYDTERNVWARFEDGRATLGVNTVLAWLSGPLTSVSFKEVGTVVEKGKSLGSTEGPRHFDTVKSPLTGRITEVNSLLKDDPKLLNRDPYGKGWFVKLEALKPEEKKDLLAIGAAKGALEEKIDEFKVRCFAAFPDYEMFEIGSECAGILVKLDDLISRSPKGTVVHLVSDDITAEIELIAWSDRTQQEILETRREGNLFHFIIKKTH